MKTALLACGEKFLTEHNEAAAWRLYKTLFAPGQPTTIRVAALRGLLLARNDKAISPLVAAIRSPDATLSAGAIGVSGFGRGPAITKALADLLPSLSYPKQELLLRALEARREPAAMTAVIAAAGSDNEAVRTAACAALGTVGDDSAAELLTRRAASARGAEQQAARVSLTQLDRGNVTCAIVQCLSSREPAVQVEAIRALASRRATVAFNELLNLATDRNDTLRREAFRALGLLANQQNLADLVKLTASLTESEDLASAEQALTGAFQRLRDPEKLAAPVVAELRNAPEIAQPTLLALLSQAPTPAGLTAVRALMNEQYPTVYEGAIRSLAEWPNAAPAEDLLNVVRTAPRPACKAIALRGYVRMAGLGTNAGAMYARALEVADRPEDKRLVIGSLGAAAPEQALTLVEPYLKDQQLHAEAAQALVQIAERFRQTDAVRAKAILKEVLGSTSDATVCQQAREVLNQIEPYEAHILQWVGSGPYQDKDKDARTLFDTVFPPEKSDATDVKWTTLTRGVGTWEINLSEALGGADNVAGYLRTRVWSPTAQDVRFELGSDDGIRVWLNGSVIHANNVERGMAPRQDMAKANLKEGWNDLLLKVTNSGGGWACSCRIRQPDGSALDGLKFEPR
jgi:HEAT repeat protein